MEHSALKRTACQLYGVLCDCLDHSAYTGLAWPKVDTLARRMKVTPRTVQTALKDLALAGWIGTPFGDSGGSREGVVYHLHPDGKPCLFCVAADRTLNQRCKTQPLQHTGERISPVKTATGEISAPVTPAIFSPVTALTGEVFAATGEIFDSAYKEKNSLSTLPNSSTTTAANSNAPQPEPPEEFLRIMDADIELDESALRRLWRDARQIVPDATPEEVRHFFRERGHRVFRNRRIENPVGLLLSSISDWFVRRRVLQRREEQRRAAEEYEILKRELEREEAKEPQSQTVTISVPEKAPVIAVLGEPFDVSDAIRSAAARKALR